MAGIEVRNNLEAPHSGTNSPLYRLIASKIKSAAAMPDLTLLDYSALWSSEWWGLSSSSVFAKLAVHQQNDVLRRCNQSLLSEAYFIEKSGLAYSAKMVLTAQNTDEAQLYAFIGADEARHLAWVEPYLPVDSKRLPDGHFLSFLSGLIEEYPRHLLIYLVQIILEGWGLDHYHRLSKYCLNPDLASVFAAILKDEALHHKSGTVLFDGSEISARDYSLIEDALQHYTMIVRVGPLSALVAVDAVAGGLSATELEDVVVALRHEEETPRKLQLLRKLMLQPRLEQIVEILEAEECFLPASSREVVDCYLSYR